MLFPAFTNLICLQKAQNPFSHTPCLCTLFCGPWKIRFVLPLYLNPLHWEVWEGISMFQPLCASPLLDSIHTSPGSGHPGSQRTLLLFRNRYWWPSMVKEVACYVKGSSVCAIASTPRCLPEGKLVSLPIPCRPIFELISLWIFYLPMVTPPY